jgi:phosphopantetheinyl transferase
MRDQKLLRSFCSVQNYQNRMNHDSFNNQHMEIAQENEDEDLNCKAVFDLNWSHDGTVIAAGIEKQVVMLDINQIFSTPIESLLNQ